MALFRNRKRSVVNLQKRERKVRIMSEKILPIAEGKVLQECIKTYGIPAQIDLAIEEMSELIKALLKERRAVRKNDTEAYNLALVNVAEEMADVIIMLTQLTLIFKNQKEIDKFINFKLRREKRRLEKVKTEVSGYGS